MALLSLHDIRMKAGNSILLDGVSLHIEKGERVCLLGRNGSGKSTLMKIMAEELAPDSGSISATTGARVAYLAQEVPRGIGGRVFDVAAGAAPGGVVEEHLVYATLMNLGLDSEADFDTLSGGLKRRAMLARALVSKPDLLLLDEPTNHLDIDSITWLEERLMRYVRTLLFVTHDRTFLRRLSTRIVEIDRGNVSSWACGYDLYLERKAAALEAEAKQSLNFDRKLAEEEAWVRRGVKARTTRNEGRVRALKQMRQERRERRDVIGTVRMGAQDTERSGHIVFEAKDATFAYGDEAPVVRDLSTLIIRGDKVGIIGANGSGKTTTLRLLLGELEAQSGTVRQGTRLQVAYFDQLRAGLDETSTVRQNVAGENDTVLVNGERRHIVGYLSEFLFSPERARTAVSVLSGGERNRLLLAELFTQPANLLVMDEPTNDLDAETLELLEDLLVNYKGTLLIVSHDRDFLNNVVTSTLAPAGDGRWREYVGGYDDWQRQSAAEKAAATPRSVAAPRKNGGTVAPAKPIAARPSSSRLRKLSFKEQTELSELPARIEALEAEHTALVAQLADPAFYKADPAATKRAQGRLAEVEIESVAAFQRWEALEALNAGTT